MDAMPSDPVAPDDARPDRLGFDSGSADANASAGASAAAELSYEQARDELIAVVSRLEQGTPTLEESLKLWERGEELARRCEEWLIGAKARLDAARAGAASATGGNEPHGDAA
jgi:exodeoxyribonuclease VII small subunit